MAKSSAIESYLGGIDADLKLRFVRVFDYVLNNLRLGRPAHQVRSENLQAYFVTGTTASVANTEFSIAHGLGSAPYVLVPMLDLQAVNARLVPLTVTRAADASRIYLSSSETDAPVTVLIEAPGV